MDFKGVKQLVSSQLCNAANFVKVDLHVHTDESHDFPQDTAFGAITVSVTDADKNPSAVSFLQAAQKAGLRLIAFTDHMACRRSCEIASKSSPGITALPGIEVSLRVSPSGDVIHLLCVFKEGSGPEDIEHIFKDLKIAPYKDRGVPGYAVDAEIRSFVDAVHASNGLCIASHVNTEAGLRKLFFENDVEYVTIHNKIKFLKQDKTLSKEERDSATGVLSQQANTLLTGIQNDYLNYLVDSNIDAVQVQKSTDFTHYSGSHTEQLGIRPIAAVLSTDAHNIGSIGYDKKITFAKMAQPSWANLRLALQDPETRLRYADNVATHRYPKVKGIVFVGGEGFFRPLQSSPNTPQCVAFSDNLTTLIGGRGSGKSACIDALRYVFKNEAELKSLPGKLREDVTGRLDHTMKDTTVYVLMESKEGEDILVKTYYDGWERRNYESTYSSGEAAAVDLSQSTDFHVDIYGWSEIETLGTDTKQQLDLIDKFIPDIGDIQKSIQQSRRSLEQNRAQIKTGAKQVSDLINQVKDYEEVKAAYERINTPEMQKQFEQLDIAAIKAERLRATTVELNSASEIAQTVGHITTRIDTAGALLGKDLPESLQSWKSSIWSSIVTPERMENIRSATGVILSELEKIIQNIESIQSSVTEDIAKINSELTASVPALDVKSVAAIGKRNSYKMRFDALTRVKQDISEGRSRVHDLMKQRRSLLVEFYKLLDQRSSKRKAIRDSVNSELAKNVNAELKIDVEFFALRDRQVFIAGLGDNQHDGLLRGLSKQYKQRKFAETLSQSLSPAEFVSAILDGKAEKLQAVNSDEKNEISGEDASAILAWLTPDRNEYGETYYDSAKLDSILGLQEVDLNDVPQIRLDGIPIMSLSPGQRCSALIPIILLQGNCPLIIDQPEDNLDNKLVFDLVVDILRRLKERRQIIVATHNPNLPVSGDAEQIVVFDAIDKVSGRTVIQGSIDSDQIVKHVTSVMEGGEEAFRIRARKYKFDLSDYRSLPKSLSSASVG